MSDRKIELINKELITCDASELDEFLQQLHSRRPTMTLTFPSVPSFKEDYSTQNFELIESGGMVPTLSGDVTLDFKSVILAGDGTSISGSVMDGRAKEWEGDRNQMDREIFLANQDKIPAKYRGKYVIFPKTKWRYRSSRGVFVPIAFWGGGEWFPALRYLGYQWGAGDLLVVPRNNS